MTPEYFSRIISVSTKVNEQSLSTAPVKGVTIPVSWCIYGTKIVISLDLAITHHIWTWQERETDELLLSRRR